MRIMHRFGVYIAMAMLLSMALAQVNTNIFAPTSSPIALIGDASTIRVNNSVLNSPSNSTIVPGISPAAGMMPGPSTIQFANQNPSTVQVNRATNQVPVQSATNQNVAQSANPTTMFQQPTSAHISSPPQQPQSRAPVAATTMPPQVVQQPQSDAPLPPSSPLDTPPTVIMPRPTSSSIVVVTPDQQPTATGAIAPRSTVLPVEPSASAAVGVATQRLSSNPASISPTAMTMRMVSGGQSSPVAAPLSTNMRSSVFVGTQFPTSWTTPQMAPETARHFQIAFVNKYNQTIPTGTNITAYGAALVPSVAMAAGVRQDRITDMTVASQPDTDNVLLRFTVQPISSTGCLSTSPPCGASVESAALRLYYLVVSSASLQLLDRNSKVLMVAANDVYPSFRQWTDNGPCPTSFCNKETQVCDCTLVGNLYCPDIKDTSRGPQLLYLLLLLLLIPIIIIVIVVVYLVLRHRKNAAEAEDEKKAERRMIRADMLSYHEYVAREKKPPTQAQLQQPKIATIASRSTLNESTLGSLYRSLGENVSIAFNGATFIDASGTVDNNSDCSSNASILPSNNKDDDDQ